MKDFIFGRRNAGNNVDTAVDDDTFLWMLLLLLAEFFVDFDGDEALLVGVNELWGIIDNLANFCWIAFGRSFSPPSTLPISDADDVGLLFVVTPLGGIISSTSFCCFIIVEDGL